MVHLDRRKLAQVMYMTSAYRGHDGDPRCHVCLCEKRLTKEHVPPQSAFNDCTSLYERLVTPEGSSDSARLVKVRGGFWVRTLCKACNNDLCGPYAESYVKFARHLVDTPELFDATGRARLVSVPGDTLMIAKEVATMILAIEPASYAEHNHQLRRFVLDPNATFLPNFRVLAFMVPDAPQAGTITRFHARIDTLAPGYGFMGGEISGFPFGFVYACQVGPGYVTGAMTDITHWFTRGNQDDRRGQSVRLFSRVTGVDSIQCGVGRERVRPQIDFA